MFYTISCTVLLKIKRLLYILIDFFMLPSVRLVIEFLLAFQIVTRFSKTKNNVKRDFGRKNPY